MKKIHKPDNYWTKEKCAEEALKYKTRKEFSDKNGSAYGKSRKNKWLNEICIHMVEILKPVRYWTKERCQEEALKYTTRNDFRKKSPSAYNASLKKNWLNDICGHVLQLI